MFKKDGSGHYSPVKYILGFTMIFLFVVLSVFVIFKIRNEARQFSYIGRADVPVNTIVVEGTGKVTSVPDLAKISLGVETQASTVSKAQVDNTKKMNAIISAVKEMGVVDKDIKTTNYSIWPRYNYDRDTGVSNIIGYTINQSVEISIRELDKIGDILQKSGDLGANQVGGINFTIDNPETLKSQAREKAIEDAKVKAVTLFKSIGVKPGRIVGYNEVYPGSYCPYYSSSVSLKEGIGGAGVPAPDVEVGSQDVEVNISLIYELQ